MADMNQKPDENNQNTRPNQRPIDETRNAPQSNVRGPGGASNPSPSSTNPPSTPNVHPGSSSMGNLPSSLTSPSNPVGHSTGSTMNNPGAGTTPSHSINPSSSNPSGLNQPGQNMPTTSAAGTSNASSITGGHQGTQSGHQPANAFSGQTGNPSSGGPAEKAGEIASNVKETVSQKAEDVSEMVGEKMSDVRQTATQLKERAMDTASEVSQNAQPWVNRISTTASDLNTRTRDLVHKGNERRLILERKNRTMLDVPLTVAGLGGALLVLAAPGLAALSVIGAFFGKVSARIERNNPL